MATRSISAQEKEWRAESDAHTLMEYGAIVKDKERLKLAKAKAKKLLKEEKAKVASLESLINIKGNDSD